jgi:hypothetical protein
LDCTKYAEAGLCLMSMANDPRQAKFKTGQKEPQENAVMVEMPGQPGDVRIFKIRDAAIAKGDEILYKYSDKDTFFLTP